MHDSAGYTFHGSAPISGLTPVEVDTLLLGHLVKQRKQSGNDGGVSKQKREIRRGHQEAREEMLRDVGIH